MASRVHLRAEAAADLDSIATFSLQNFGPTQAKRFRESFLKVFDLLVVFPHLGAPYPDRSDLRRHVHEAHAIYYRVDGEEIVVSRILGPGQDPTREFED